MICCNSCARKKCSRPDGKYTKVVMESCDRYLRHDIFKASFMEVAMTSNLQSFYDTLNGLGMRLKKNKNGKLFVIMGR